MGSMVDHYRRELESGAFDRATIPTRDGSRIFSIKDAGCVAFWPDNGGLTIVELSRRRAQASGERVIDDSRAESGRDLDIRCDASA